MNTLTDSIAAAVAQLPVTSLEDVASVQLMRRFDTKYVVPDSWLPELVMKMAPEAHLLEINGTLECCYDNLYFELPGDQFLQDHLRGKARRMKVRKRRYDSNGKVFLEVKERLPGGRTIKNRIQTSNGLNPEFNAEEMAFLQGHLKDPTALTPRLTGAFLRTTMVDFKRRERVTVDRQLSAALFGAQAAPMLQGLAVIEVKQPRPDRYSPIQLWLRSRKERKGLIGRKTRVSKYTTARLSHDGNLTGRTYLATYRRLQEASSWAEDLQARTAHD